MIQGQEHQIRGEKQSWSVNSIWIQITSQKLKTTERPEWFFLSNSSFAGNLKHHILIQTPGVHLPSMFPLLCPHFSENSNRGKEEHKLCLQAGYKWCHKMKEESLVTWFYSWKKKSLHLVICKLLREPQIGNFKEMKLQCKINPKDFFQLDREKDKEWSKPDFEMKWQQKLLQN